MFNSTLQTASKTPKQSSRSAVDAINSDWRSNVLLTAAGAAAGARLMAVADQVELEQGQLLYPAGQPNAHVYFPHGAVISHVYNSAEGESVEAALIGPEGVSGLCGSLRQLVPQHSAVVTIAGAATRIRTEDLRDEMATPGPLQTALFDHLAAQVGEVGLRVACKSFHYAHERLCTWLLMLVERAGTNEMRITHEAISNLLGINRTSVSSIAKRLKDDGAVDYLRGKIHIIDTAKLVTLACDCYAASRAMQQVH